MNVKFLDAESMQGGNDEKITFNLLFMEQIRRILVLSNREFRGGYTNQIITKDGMVKEEYIQDSREVYSNSVYSLALLLYPKFDDKAVEDFNTFNNKIEKNNKEFMDRTEINEGVVLPADFYKDDNMILEEFKQKKLALYLDLFKYLSCFLKRNNYLEAQAFTDEDD